MSTPLNEYPGQVTIADLFRVMSAIQSDLSKALTKLEVIDTRNTAADATSGDHENRLRKLESAYQRVYGAAVAIGTVAGVISGWLSSLAHHAH